MDNQNMFLITLNGKPICYSVTRHYAIRILKSIINKRIQNLDKSVYEINKITSPLIGLTKIELSIQEETVGYIYNSYVKNTDVYEIVEIPTYNLNE